MPTQLQNAMIANVTVNQTWLDNWYKFSWYLDLLKDFYFWLVQGLVDMATWALSNAADLMPSFDIATDSVQSLNVDASQIFSFIAWIFPFDALFFCLALVALNYFAFYTAGPLLRWVKVIQ